MVVGHVEENEVGVTERLKLFLSVRASYVLFI